MSDISKLYDRIAVTYNQSESAQVLDRAHQALMQLLATHPVNAQRILGLGVGDGNELLLFKDKYPHAAFGALDISANMLALAKQKLEFDDYQGDIRDAATIIHDKYDLITALFVCAYVPLNLTLQQCDKLLSEQGSVLLLTNTSFSFSLLQQYFQQFTASNNPMKKFIAARAKHSIQATTVPKDFDAIKHYCDIAGFEVVAHESIVIPIRLKDRQAFFEFFIDGSWFVSALHQGWVPQSCVLWFLKRLTDAVIEFPYEDSLSIEACVIQRTVD